MCIDCGNPLLLCPVKQRPNAPAPPPRELPRLRPIYATGAAGSRPRAELFPTTVIGSLPRPDWVSDIVLGKKDGALGAEYVPRAEHAFFVLLRPRPCCRHRPAG